MQAVGSIQYIAVLTRPDLEFAAHVVARHMESQEALVGCPAYYEIPAEYD